MTIFYGIFIWVNAWLADRSFRNRRPVWGAMCAVMSAICCALWLRSVW